MRYVCPGCDYTYDEQAGDSREDWACPDCGVREKVDFEPTDG